MRPCRACSDRACVLCWETRDEAALINPLQFSIPSSTPSQQEYDPDPTANDRRYWVSVAQTNVLPRVGLDKCLRLFKLRGLDVLRCHMDRVNDPGNGSVCLLRMLVQIHDKCEPWKTNGPEWTGLTKELHRVKWLDDATIERECLSLPPPVCLPVCLRCDRSQHVNPTPNPQPTQPQPHSGDRQVPLAGPGPRGGDRGAGPHAPRRAGQAEPVGLLQGVHLQQALGPAHRAARGQGTRRTGVPSSG